MSIHMEKNSKKILIYLNFKKLILKNVTFFKKNKPKIVFFSFSKLSLTVQSLNCLVNYT